MMKIAHYDRKYQYEFPQITEMFETFLIAGYD